METGRVLHVPVELARVALDLIVVRAGEVAAAGEEQVESAVAIKIEHRQAAADLLQDRVLIGFLPIPIHEVHAAGAGHVAEDRRTGFQRRTLRGRGCGRGWRRRAGPDDGQQDRDQSGGRTAVKSPTQDNHGFLRRPDGAWRPGQRLRPKGVAGAAADPVRFYLTPAYSQRLALRTTHTFPSRRTPEVVLAAQGETVPVPDSIIHHNSCCHLILWRRHPSATELGFPTHPATIMACLETVHEWKRARHPAVGRGTEQGGNDSSGLPGRRDEAALSHLCPVGHHRRAPCPTCATASSRCSGASCTRCTTTCSLHADGRPRQVRQHRRRRHGQLPPARRRGRLRCPGAPGPGLGDARAAGGRPGQLRLGGRRPARRLPLHRGQADRRRRSPAWRSCASAPWHMRPNYDEHAARSRSSCRPSFPTCSSTAPPASPSAWPRTFRRTTSAR